MAVCFINFSSNSELSLNQLLTPALQENTVDPQIMKWTLNITLSERSKSTFNINVDHASQWDFFV